MLLGIIDSYENDWVHWQNELSTEDNFFLFTMQECSNKLKVKLSFWKWLFAPIKYVSFLEENFMKAMTVF